MTAQAAAHGLGLALVPRLLIEAELARGELVVACNQTRQSERAYYLVTPERDDERPVVTESEPVSMSRETTFERDLHAVRDRAELGAIFTRLCEQVAADLQRKGYVGKTIGIKLRFDDFTLVTRDQTIGQATADAAEIRRVEGQCLKRAPLAKRLRLLGVRVGALSAAGDVAHTTRADPAPPESGGQTGLLF